jgi:hypothetical protein
MVEISPRHPERCSLIGFLRGHDRAATRITPLPDDQNHAGIILDATDQGGTSKGKTGHSQ